MIYVFSVAPNWPCLEVRRFPELHALREIRRTIRDEALQLFDEGYLGAASGYDNVGFNSFFRTGWKRFYLKWYDDALPSARKLRPKTVALVESIPGIRGAMFALLPPGGRLVRHRDPFAGSLRNRLGLVTPNSEDCHISVDGEPVGFLCRLFGYVNRVRLPSKRLKAWNRHACYAQKYLLLSLLLSRIFARAVGCVPPAQADRLRESPPRAGWKPRPFA